MVSGTPCHMYFVAWNSPAESETVEISGAFISEQDAEGNENIIVEGVRTQHKGKGRFYFEPKFGFRYFLDVPVGGPTGFQRREIGMQEWNDINFHPKQRVLEQGEDLNVLLYPNKNVDTASTYLMTLSVKEQRLYSHTFKMDQASPKELSIPASNFPLITGGVLTLNVFKMNEEIIYYMDELARDGGRRLQDADEEPMIEPGIAEPGIAPAPSIRAPDSDDSGIPPIYTWEENKGEILVFKKPSTQIDVKIETNEDTYAPGNDVSFDVTLTNSTNGK